MLRLRAQEMHHRDGLVMGNRAKYGIFMGQKIVLSSATSDMRPWTARVELQLTFIAVPSTSTIIYSSTYLDICPRPFG